MTDGCFGTKQFNQESLICKACERFEMCREFVRSGLESSLSPMGDNRYLKVGIEKPKVGMSSLSLNVRNPIPKKLRS